MAERDQLVGSLCRHDAGNDRRREYRAFLADDLVTLERIENGLRQDHDGPRMRLACGRDLVADIDHRGPIMFVDVSQLAHGIHHATVRALNSARSGRTLERIL